MAHLSPAGHRGLVRPTPAATAQFTQSMRPVSARRPSTRQRLQVSALRGDPWKVLGVPHDASEKDIKQAHRKLVRQLHPDVAKEGKELGRFMAVQEAYELVLGRRQGKEVEGRPSNSSGWDFHDWYWSFSMKRRRKHQPEAEGPPLPSAMRQQWQSQMAGLKQKAAAKGRPGRGRAEPSAPRQSTSESVWRSTTWNARTKKGAAPGAAAEAAAPGQHLGSAVAEAAAQAAAQPEPAPIHGEQPAEQHQPGHSTPTVGSADAAAEAASSQLLHSLLRVGLQRHHVALSAVHHAVHARLAPRSPGLASHILELSHQLRSRLAQRLQPAATAGEAQLHHEFEAEAFARRYNSDPASMAASEQAHQSSEAEQQHQRLYDAHARKFAERDHVEERLGSQLAGLRRRSTMRHEQ